MEELWDIHPAQAHGKNDPPTDKGGPGVDRKNTSTSPTCAGNDDADNHADAESNPETGPIPIPDKFFRGPDALPPGSTATEHRTPPAPDAPNPATATAYSAGAAEANQSPPSPPSPSIPSPPFRPSPDAADAPRQISTPDRERRRAEQIELTSPARVARGLRAGLRALRIDGPAGGSNARPIGPTATPHTNGPTATPQTGSLATDRSLSAMTGMSDTSDMLSMLDSVQLDTGASSRSPRGSRGGSHRSSIDDREGRSSPFDNSVNSPIYFRKVDDLAFTYTPGYDSGDDTATDARGDAIDANAGDGEVTDADDDTAPSSQATSVPSSANTTLTDSSPAPSQIGDDGLFADGFFGRVGQVLRRTRDDVNALFGCAGPSCASPNGSGAGVPSAKNRPRDFEVSFEEIQELNFLGSGAVGCVFLGIYQGEKVAIKKFKDVNPTLIETRQLRALNHENIVQFLGVCTTPPVYCIVMEYCPRSLYDDIKDKRIPPKMVCDWARQVACGMQYLHSKNQIHRDLKSPNILVAQDGTTLKISDFGTSRTFGSKSVTMSFCGSVSWMAPEMIKGDPCGKKVDIWSFGVVLWELLTGEIPYAGVDQAAVIYGIGNESLHLPVPSTAPLGFSLLLKQCWNPSPKHRPEFRQILLHLQIVQDDDGFLGVPEASYFQTQQNWKAEMIAEFGKMKKEEIEIRRADQALLKQREEELRHAQDVRQLYESRLWNITTLLQTLKDRERELRVREKAVRKKEKLLGSASKRNVKKKVPTRKWSEASLSEIGGGRRSGPNSHSHGHGRPGRKSGARESFEAALQNQKALPPPSIGKLPAAVGVVTVGICKGKLPSQAGSGSGVRLGSPGRKIGGRHGLSPKVSKV